MIEPTETETKESLDAFAGRPPARASVRRTRTPGAAQEEAARRPPRAA